MTSGKQLAREIVPEFQFAGQFDRTEWYWNSLVGTILFAEYNAAK